MAFATDAKITSCPLHEGDRGPGLKDSESSSRVPFGDLLHLTGG